MMIVGSVGNAGLAAVVLVLAGDAFNTMLKSTPDTSVLIPLALIICSPLYISQNKPIQRFDYN